MNRDLARALLRRGDVELGLADIDGARLDPSDPAFAALEPYVSGLLPRVDVTLRHAYPPSLGPVHDGRVAQFLHWEYGAPPVEWVRAQTGHLDEVWVASRHVHDGFAAGGMDTERLQLVRSASTPAASGRAPTRSTSATARRASGSCSWEASSGARASTSCSRPTCAPSPVTTT